MILSFFGSDGVPPDNMVEIVVDIVCDPIIERTFGFVILFIVASLPIIGKQLINDISFR